MTPSTTTRDSMTLVGRALLSLLFIPAGVSKIAHFAGTAGYIASQGVPFPELCAALAIAAELGLGLLLLVGWQARWAALGLALFVLVITPIFHKFWGGLPAAQQMMQQQAFFKNIAVAGGLLVVAALGAGGWSLDGRRERV